MRCAALVMAVLAAGALAGCTATSAGTAATASRTASAAASAAARVGRATAAQPKPEATPGPPPPQKPAALPVAPPGAGALPQTRTLPSTTDTAFKNLIHDFWLAVTTGNPDYAKPAFFPEKAYEQVKAIADPDQDWQTRLWDEFALDVKAVRPLIGRDARLLKVIVPMQYAIWVPPGACYNSHRVLARPRRASRVRAGRGHPLVRDHVADFLARRLVPGPPRRLQQDRPRGHRRRRGAGAGRARPAGRLLAAAPPAATRRSPRPPAPTP